MNYKNYKCDGCGEIFGENDDVVVCPECATPQHRSCYEKNNQCVNSHLHSESFLWKGEKIDTKEDDEPVSTLYKKEEKFDGEPLICPACEAKNSTDATRCSQCGMSFTFLGVNAVKMAQEEEKREREEKFNSSDDASGERNDFLEVPDYKPPFNVLSEEEQFYQSQRKQTHSATKEEEFQSSLRNFVGPQYSKYKEKFKKMAGNHLSFNWAAFFFGPFWFFYRKLNRAGIVFLTISAVINVVFSPFAANLMEFYSTIDYEALEEMSTEALTALFSELQGLMMPILLMMAFLLALHIACGFFADVFYRKHCVSNLQRMEGMDAALKNMTIARYGRVSYLFPMMAYCFEEFIMLLAGMILK